MTGVDFSGGRWRYAEFRDLDLGGVRLPVDYEHVIFEDYPEVLDRLLSFLATRTDSASKSLTDGLNVLHRWAPKRGRGVINRQDLADSAGEAAVRDLYSYAQPKIHHRFDNIGCLEIFPCRAGSS